MERDNKMFKQCPCTVIRQSTVDLDFSKNGDCKYMPVISGEDISTSAELLFEISSEDGFEFSFNSYCNLMNDGTSMGYTHICNGCRTSEGKVETVQIEINSIAER